MRIHYSKGFALACLPLLVLLSTTLSAAEIRRASEPIIGRYIVALPYDTTDVSSLAAQLAGKYDGKVLTVWRHALKGFYAEFAADDVERLARDVRVTAIEEDAVVHSSAAGSQVTGPPPRQTAVPQLPGAPSADDALWHLTRISHRDHQTAIPGRTNGENPSADDRDYFTYFYSNDGRADDGRRATIYIIDSGVLARHREFVDNVRPEGSRPAVEPGSNRAANPDYDNGIKPDFAPTDPSEATNPCGGNVTDASTAAHGTAVASLAVGEYVGVAKGAVLVPVGLLSCDRNNPNSVVTTAALMLSALDWVADDSSKLDPDVPSMQKLAVLSMSSYRGTQSQGAMACGSAPGLCSGFDDMTVLEEAITRIVDSGVPVVVSANNQAADACATTPARLSRRGGRTVFGRRTRVITVGATARNDARWDTGIVSADAGSNFGQCVDIWAPGAELRVASTNRDNDDDSEDHNDYTLYKAADQASGTSYSAPIVAGIVARMLAGDPSLTVDRFATADKVWTQLQRNATHLAPDSMGEGSPSLLAYLGAANFIEQPEHVTAPAGSRVTLSVQMKETTDLTYQWFRGAAGDTRLPITSATESSYEFTICQSGLNCDQPVDTTAGQDFWVRVRRGSVPGFADSNSARVRIGTACPLRPEIVDQPASFWTPDQTPTGEVTLKAKVRSSVAFCYQWQRVGAAPADQPPIVTGQPPTSEATVTLPVPASDKRVRHYRLVVWPDGFCGTSQSGSSCVTVSDTAQVRLCVRPTADAFGVTVREYDTNLDNLSETLRAPISGEDVQYRWLYAPPGGTPTQPLRIELDGGAWRTFRGLFLAPPLPGVYAVEGANSCGKVTSSNTVSITKVRDYQVVVRVDDGIPWPSRLLPTAPRFVGPCRRAKIFVEVTQLGDAIPRKPNFEWSLQPGDERQRKNVPNDTLLTAPLVGNRDVIVKIVDPVTGQFEDDAQSGRPDYELVIRLGTTGVCSTECPSSSTNFSILAGQCTLNAQPVYTHHQGGLVEIVPYLRDLNTNTKLSDAEFTFQWLLVNPNGTKTEIAQTPTLQRLVGTSVEDLEVIARRGNECDRMPIQIRPKTTSCDKCTYRCKRRAVLHVNGVPTETLTVASGQQLVLSVPEPEAAAAYEWHRDTATSADEIFSTSAEVTVAPTESTTYYFMMINAANEAETSANTYIGIEGAGNGAAVAEPPIQVVGAGALVTLTAFIPNVARIPSMRYEWRRGSDYDVTRPVIGTDAVLTLQDPPDDASYWCRIIKDGISYDTNIATVVVNCSPIGGTIFSTPSSGRIARGDLPRLEAHGIGKLLMYRWEQWLANDSSATFAGIGPVLRPYVTAPVTHFKVTAEDACGTNASFGSVAVYLCVPTITMHPQGQTIAPGTPVTMTVAATPAVDGATLEYEWYRSSDPNRTNRLHTGTSYTTTLPGGTISDSFYVAVKSSCGDSPHYTISEPAIINVCDHPTVTSNSVASITGPGQQAVLSVSVSGRGEMSYQWYRGASGNTATPLEGETSHYLVVSPTSTTNYWCRVTADGTCTSNGPTITVPVCSPPVIQTQPVSKSIFSGMTTSVSVIANAGTNTEPLRYQWYQQSASSPWTPISGATGATYATSALTTATSFRVEVAAGSCTITSGAAIISMCISPEVINSVPMETRTKAGQSVTLHVPAMSPVYDKMVRWFEGESGIRSTSAGGGYLNAALTIAPTTTKKYWAEVEHNGCISRTTSYAVTVCIPTFVQQPPNRNITAGQSTTLTATTDVPATFQWYVGAPGDTNQPVLNGATASGITSSITVSPLSDTEYWVRATGCDVTDSVAAMVTVCQPPVITNQTPNVWINRGNSIQLNVSANGTNLTHQWYQGNSGVTTTPLASTDPFMTVAPQNTANYWARVTNGCGSKDTPTITISVCAPSTITVQPQSQNIFSGTSATLSVTATQATTTPITYQWYSGTAPAGTAIGGATSASYTTPALTSQSNYWVKVIAGSCTVNSNTAVISMCAYPAVIAGPADRQAKSGDAVQLTFAISPVPDQYRWYRGVSGDTSQPITGWQASSSVTVFPTVTTPYWVEVKIGTCVSRATTTNVVVCIPTITQQPPNRAIAAGQSTSLTVATDVSATFQWYVGAPGNTSSPVPNGTTATSTVSPTADTQYWVRAIGCGGIPTDSAAAMVTVCQPPVISNQTPSIWINRGNSIQLSVNATGSGLMYQWYQGNAGVTTTPLASTSPLITVSPQNTTNYWARVTNGCGSKDTPTITISVCAPPVITAQPQSRSIRSGTTTTLSVTATQATTTPMTYQWYSGTAPSGTAIAGATSATYTTPVLTGPATYWVKVTAGTCTTNSVTATITMCALPEVITPSPQNHYTTPGDAVTLTMNNVAPAGKAVTWFRAASGVRTNQIGSPGVDLNLIVNPTTTTQYWAEFVYNGCTSRSLTITVNPCVPRITEQPTEHWTWFGNEATFTLNTVPLPGQTIQWYDGQSGDTSNPVAGATGTSLTVTGYFETYYWARVTGPAPCNTPIDSETARLGIY